MQDLQEDFQSFTESFKNFAQENSQNYKSAAPFPHVIIDDMVPTHLLQSVKSEFPSIDEPIWHRTHDEGIQIKLRTDWKSDFDIPLHTRNLVHYLNSGSFMRELSKLTGIQRLISDPYYTGGGLNAILPGGQLALHCDGNWHDDMALHRRLNLIIYLNEDWDDSWGGELQFWDEKMDNRVKSIFPRNNRIVIFTTHDKTFHGHPEPLACPEGRMRKSLILYYYTSEARDASERLTDQVHRAMWQDPEKGVSFDNGRVLDTKVRIT